jgi:hypothetical protein
MRNGYKILDGKPHLGVDRIILKWILKKSGVRMLNGFIWLRIQTSGKLL